MIAVLPGSVYIWAFERQASAFGVNLADRTLRFIAMSLLFHLILGWPEYWLYRLAFTAERFAAGQFAAAWGAGVVLMMIPAIVGTVLGGMYATRGTRTGWTWIRNSLSADQEDRLLRAALGKTPAPRAWDDLFSDAPFAYLRVKTISGEWIAGLFADHSYAGGYPHEADLLLEDVWQVSDDGFLLQSLGYPVYIPAGQIAWLEVIPQQENHEEDTGVTQQSG